MRAPRERLPLQVMANIDFDDSRFPLVIITFNAAAPRDEFMAYLDRMDALSARGERIALVYHARPAATSRDNMDLQIEWLKKRRDLLANRCVGCAFVLESVAQRFLLSAALMFQLLPYTVSATVPEAVAWAEGQLRNPPPPKTLAEPLRSIAPRRAPSAARAPQHKP